MASSTALIRSSVELDASLELLNLFQVRSNTIAKLSALLKTRSLSALAATKDTINSASLGARNLI